MANVANKYKLGVFVVAAVTLFIVSMLLLGALRFLEDKAQFMTVTKASVQGLEKGAKVKYRGVPIGQVTEIKISPTNEQILIYMEITAKSVDYEILSKSGERDRAAIEKFLNAEIEKGLRCQLRYGSAVTGSLYVEISYFTPPEYYPIPSDVVLPPGHPFYMPSVPPVLFGNIMDTIQQSLEKISKIDFAKLSGEVESLMHTANKMLDEPQIHEIVTEVHEISVNLNDISKTLKGTLTKEKIEGVVKDLTNTVNSIEELARRAREVLDKAQIPETVKDARALMQTSKTSLQMVGPLRRDVENTLLNLNNTLRSVQTLAEYLEKDPSALIRGKQEKGVVKP